ncbi:MAG: NDP-sugar synthase [Dehalococcoidia bacterium]|nr:NDP-sugar synthase [Dehalococcoidia bacterium]
MRAIILAGGEGTRLRPLTTSLPKQLVPVLNRPFIEYQLRYLLRHDVTEVTLALTRNAHSERLRAALGDRAHGIDIRYAYEEQPLGSGGAIAGAAAGWTEPFLVCNGDIVTDVDMSALIEAHRAARAELTLFLQPVENPSAYGVVALNDSSEVTRFVEKPAPGTEPSNLVNAGIWLFEAHLLQEMTATRANQVEKELFPTLASSGRRVLGYQAPTPAYWRDIGTPRTYLEANIDALLGRVSGLETTGSRDGHMLPSDIEVHTTATVRHAVVGARSVLEAGVHVESSVLWERVRVGEGAIVRDSVLASDVVISPGAVVEGQTLGEGERV